MQPETVDLTGMPEAYQNMYQEMTYEGVNQGSAAFMGAMMGFWMAFYAIVMVVMIAAQWKVFTKAGKPGWAALVPFYNLYIMVKIAGMSAWWMLAFFVPFVNLIAIILITHKISQVFGHGVGFTLGLIFLPVIFWPILGFGSSSYQPAQVKAE